MVHQDGGTPWIHCKKKMEVDLTREDVISVALWIRAVAHLLCHGLELHPFSSQVF